MCVSVSVCVCVCGGRTKRSEVRSTYFSSVCERIFFSFCMLLLVSLPETERGEGERPCPSVSTALGGDDASAGVSDTGVSWRTGTVTHTHTHCEYEVCVD